MKKLLIFLVMAVLLITGCQVDVVEGSPEQNFDETATALPMETTRPTEQTQPTETMQPAEQTQPTETTQPVEETQTAETVPPFFDSLAMAMGLTLEEKVGQLFLARCPEKGALTAIEAYHLAGYILFGGDFEDETPETVRLSTTAYQETSKIPMIIAVDEEGGTVNRVSSYSQYRSSRFPSPRKLYDQGGLELIAQTEEEKCRLLTSLGINVNLSPVCDIATDKNAFLYSRSLGQSPEVTAGFVRTILKVMDENGMGGVMKHFPGYGNNSDTHTGVVRDQRTLEELESADLIPFAAGIEMKNGAIMVAHVIVEQLDGENPASLSTAVHTYLRQEMGFDGVIITDDLSMKAITDLYGAEEAAVMAVLAGNDLLCSSEFAVQYAAVLEAVQAGRIPLELLDNAVARVLRWKCDVGIITDTTVTQ